jgi:hypothetical protein
MDDWREKFLPGTKKAQKDEIREIVMHEEHDESPEPLEIEDSLRADVMSGEEPAIGEVLQTLGENQQRIMLAIDQMASGFSSQIMILARRIDNFESILEQSLGQPPMTNLLVDAPEVFNRVVQREDKEEEVQRVIEPTTPKPNWEVPDEVGHLLNFDATFPVTIEIQVAYHMWKEKLGTFQDFVKVAGGPVPAKEARNHLE